MGSDPAYWNVQPVVLDGGASTMIHGSIESRAAVIDYLQMLERGEVSKETLSERAEKSADGEYSPWRKVKEDRKSVVSGKVCKYVYNSVVAVSLKKQQKQIQNNNKS